MHGLGDMKSVGERGERGTNALVVNDLDDSSKASDELAVGEEDDAAELDEAPLRGGDFNFCHGGVAPRTTCQYVESFM